jgi:hypothetical protein
MESLVGRIAMAVMITLFPGGCGKDCTDIYIMTSLSVSLKNSQDGRLICDASVTAQRRGRDEKITLLPYGPDLESCAYRGVGDQPGVYTVTATASGYRPSVLHGIELKEGDDCHVIGRSVLLTMDPEP